MQVPDLSGGHTIRLGRFAWQAAPRIAQGSTVVHWSQASCRNACDRPYRNLRLDAAPIRATSILNGPFAELLQGEAPIVLHRLRRVLYWGDADQPFDFTTKDDVAGFTAEVALDPEAPRYLRISGDQISPRGLADVLTRMDGRRWRLLRAGGIGRLSAIIAVARALTPETDAPFPAWQGMQYLRDMSTGRGKLHQLDNARYGKTGWTGAASMLASTLS